MLLSCLWMKAVGLRCLVIQKDTDWPAASAQEPRKILASTGGLTVCWLHPAAALAASARPDQAFGGVQSSKAPFSAKAVA